MSRLKRKNRTDIEYKNKGGLLDLFDNTIKEVWRINDKEYDYIVETSTDEEILFLVNEELTIIEIKKALKFIDKKLMELYK